MSSAISGPVPGPGRWFFPVSSLQDTPSLRSGLPREKELSYRQQAANFIQDMGQRVQVTQLCINTAIVYMQRFYMFHSFQRFHRNSIAAAALFLAAKVEEQPRKLEHVIKVAHICLHRDQPQLDSRSEAYMEQAQELVTNENILLQTLGFDVAIDHPHTHVVKCCQLVKASKELAQTSYFMATNSLHLTTMCLRYSPTIVACVCIHLACKWSNYKIPKSAEGKLWFTYVDPSATLELLEKLTQEFLTIFDKCPSRLKKKIMASTKATKEEEERRARSDISASQYQPDFSIRRETPSSTGLSSSKQQQSQTNLPQKTGNRPDKLDLGPGKSMSEDYRKQSVKPPYPHHKHSTSSSSSQNSRHLQQQRRSLPTQPAIPVQQRPPQGVQKTIASSHHRHSTGGSMATMGAHSRSLQSQQQQQHTSSKTNQPPQNHHHKHHHHHHHHGHHHGHHSQQRQGGSTESVQANPKQQPTLPKPPPLPQSKPPVQPPPPSIPPRKNLPASEHPQALKSIFDIDDSPFGGTSLNTLLDPITSPANLSDVSDLGEAAAEVPLEPGEILDTPLGGAIFNFPSSSQTSSSTATKATKTSFGKTTTGASSGDIKAEPSLPGMNPSSVAFSKKAIKSEPVSTFGVASFKLDKTSSPAKKPKLEPTSPSHKDKTSRQRSLFSPVQENADFSFPTGEARDNKALTAVGVIKDEPRIEMDRVKGTASSKKEPLSLPKSSGNTPSLLSLPVSIPLGPKGSSMTPEGSSDREHKEKKKKKKDKKDKKDKEKRKDTDSPRGEKKHKNKHKDRDREKYSKLKVEPPSSGGSTPTNVSGIKLKIKTPSITGGTSSEHSSPYIPSITISLGSEGTMTGSKKRSKPVGASEGPASKMSRALGTAYDMESSYLKDHVDKAGRFQQ